MKIYQIHTDKMPDKTRVHFYPGKVWAMEINGRNLYGFISKTQAEKSLIKKKPKEFNYDLD